MSVRILIVDDEPDFTFLVKLTLESTGRFEVREEHDSSSALETAQRFRPQVVILDVIMPNLTGPDVAGRFAADPLLRDVPVVYLTALPVEDGAPLDWPELGGTLLSKFTPPEELVDRIEMEVQRHSAAPSPLRNRGALNRGACVGGLV